MGHLSVNNSYTEGLLNCTGMTTTHVQQRAYKYTQLWLWLSWTQASADSIGQSMSCQPFRLGDNRQFQTGPQYYPLPAEGETKHSRFLPTWKSACSTIRCSLFGFVRMCESVWTLVGIFSMTSLSSCLLYHSPSAPRYYYLHFLLTAHDLSAAASELFH